MRKRYDRNFFSGLATGSYRAASVFLPEIRKHYAFGSVCDVGCGSGSWLRAAGECIPSGARTGIDGEHARPIADCPGAIFMFQDLEERIRGVPRHDLVISMEVAEHLSPARASTFVDDLCAIGDVVLFSGAVPHQGGRHHVNERPQSYWMGLFRRNGYGAYDVHRKALWNHEAFTGCEYYVGNALLYVRDGTSLASELSAHRLEDNALVDVVHPGLFKMATQPGVRRSFVVFLASLKQAFFRRVHRGG
ncbi:MAG TPA: hypothetical protein VFP10_07315 [Candidatus Eisenbacteria bacterium]|nr:hypothetical protein [Candidatus Eisenbacteria bacterium]